MIVKQNHFVSQTIKLIDMKNKVDLQLQGVIDKKKDMKMSIQKLEITQIITKAITVETRNTTIVTALCSLNLHMNKNRNRKQYIPLTQLETRNMFP